jgi:hypothetical protein
VNQFGCKIGYVVKCETIEHFSHVNTYIGIRMNQCFADLLEHSIVIDIDFDEWREFAINVRKITVGAKVRTAIGDWYKLIIWHAMNIETGRSIEIPCE